MIGVGLPVVLKDEDAGCIRKGGRFCFVVIVW